VTFARFAANVANAWEFLKRKEMPGVEYTRFRGETGCAKLRRFRRGLRSTVGLRTGVIFPERPLCGAKFQPMWTPAGSGLRKTKRKCHVWAFKMGHH
jgi:hypothetical protein